MKESNIHKLIEQQRTDIEPTPMPLQEVKMFTYVKDGDGYNKQYITLAELLARLSDKTLNVIEPVNTKTHLYE